MSLYPKLDGLLAVLYFYDSKWQVSFQRSADGNELLGNGKTFQELFWTTWKEANHHFPPSEYENCVFMFELIGPEIRNIIPYERNSLILHGIRRMDQPMQELDIQIIAKQDAFNWTCMQPIALNCSTSITEIQQLPVDWTSIAGVVVVDPCFRRWKFLFLNLHRVGYL